MSYLQKFGNLPIFLARFTNRYLKNVLLTHRNAMTTAVTMVDIHAFLSLGRIVSYELTWSGSLCPSQQFLNKEQKIGVNLLKNHKTVKKKRRQVQDVKRDQKFELSMFVKTCSTS